MLELKGLSLYSPFLGAVLEFVLNSKCTTSPEGKSTCGKAKCNFSVIFHKGNPTQVSFPSLVSRFPLCKVSSTLT